MKTIAWNCKGTNKTFAIRALKAMNKEHNPDYLFLSETKADEQRIDIIRRRLGFYQCFCVPSFGKVGGLAMFWKAGIEVRVLEANSWLIAMSVKQEYGHEWLLVGVYGSPYARYRREFWESLQEVVHEFGGPWMCVGDFNCIISQEEKRGGSKIGSSSGGGLREFMEDWGGIDLGFIRYEFTWCNKRCGLANIKERLDKAICNGDWRLIFPKAGVIHLPLLQSDHNPIMVVANLEVGRKARPFRFEAAWTRDASSHQVIKVAWEEPVRGSTSYRLMRRIQKAFESGIEKTLGGVTSE